eukprot:CAMPEP_0197620474 /NCGR_PEP_ID=MMETSP1338-20131121/1296_1 /TAXON_ID=43686 ORGANISM="Pelagodinium beii, Strain RCC1491" /NCGR_SAMPLE_ID=MMETSP1338 /ASSEMBLY_ACC=CAM_ASM_000754 /LENGTH=213 /DNA_ID=CAMNT_0043189675 /DNA_START=117 /DNA_END=759 /DNA_ORIENTATION=+
MHEVVPARCPAVKLPPASLLDFGGDWAWNQALHKEEQYVQMPERASSDEIYEDDGTANLLTGGYTDEDSLTTLTICGIAIGLLISCCGIIACCMCTGTRFSFTRTGQLETDLKWQRRQPKRASEGSARAAKKGDTGLPRRIGQLETDLEGQQGQPKLRIEGDPRAAKQGVAGVPGSTRSPHSLGNHPSGPKKETQAALENQKMPIPDTAPTRM